MKSKKFLVSSLTIFASFVISSCGKQGPVINSVSVSAETPTGAVSLNGTTQLSALVEGSGDFNSEVTWSVSDPALASVSEDGVLTNLSDEDAYVVVTATAKGDSSKKGTLTLLLYGEASITSVSLSNIGLTLIGDAAGTAQAEVRVRGTGEFDDSVTFAVADTSVATVDEDGLLTAVALGDTTLTATSTADPTKSATVDVKVSGAANGIKDYTRASAEERTKILAALEKYAVDTKLIGLPIYGDGGYVMYANGVVKGSNTYIPGYGFGILPEGNITADLPGETNTAYKRYYHTFETEDPGTILYMNDKGAVVGDLVAYVAASYFDTRMNEDKDGYEWFGDLAKVDRPVAVNPDSYGFATTFKFPVKVGSELKYRINSNVARLAAYNGREVTLEDYITPYKIYYTQKFGLARSAENLSGASSIKGSKEYYDGTKDKTFDQTLWDKIGIRGYEEDGVSYLEFTFNVACSPFYAMYYLASGMFAPVPYDFILACGGENNADIEAGVKCWGSSNNDKTEGPADHYLSTGAYFIDKWNTEQNIIFTKNQFYADGGRYQIPGVHVNIFPAAEDDENAAIKEFLAGNLTASGIPQDYLAKYKNDPRTTTTGTSSVYKLNLNTCDDDRWEELFGTEGSITQTPRADYWDCEPALNVPEFVEGINYSLNRKQIAEKHGRTVGYQYFGDSYMSDPENGISYNSTEEHEAAIADFVRGTDGTGYSLELARASFKKAAEKLIDDNTYKYGDTINLEIAWQTEAQKESYSEIGGYIESAFNSAGTGLKVKVDGWVGSSWTDVYYKKMMIGQFDIGFGSISGNPLNPINFLEVLKSDNSSGFTLNWGPDTGAIDGRLVYDGCAWSFDNLWLAADQGGLFENGQTVELLTVDKDPEVERGTDGSLIVYLYVTEKDLGNNIYGQVDSICIYATTDGTNYSDYDELYVDVADAEWDGTKGCYVFTFSASDIAAWLETYPADEVAAQGIDLYAVLAYGEPADAAFFKTVNKELVIPEVPQD